MFCKICGDHCIFVHEAKILAKHLVKYYRCPKCYFLQTEKPFWLEEAYQKSINISDTGYMSRNIYLSRISSVLIYLFFNRKARFIDYGGGHTSHPLKLLNILTSQIKKYATCLNIVTTFCFQQNYMGVMFH